jgi:hypothetical protein
MDQWLELHEARARDLVREAQAVHRRRALAPRRTTTFAPIRRRSAADTLETLPRPPPDRRAGASRRRPR